MEQQEAILSALLMLTCWVEGGSGCSERRGVLGPMIRVPLEGSCLENPTDGGAWWVAVHEVAKSRTWLSDFTFTFHFHALEKAMATHSSVLAWRISGTEEPGRRPSMGSQSRTRPKRLSSSSIQAPLPQIWSTASIG